jgi:L-alanine-DL-glutamate epimerase-like enolase superfamily enzyme
MQPQASVDEFYVESGVPMTPAEAYRELTAAYKSRGYKVARITPLDNGGVHATLKRI